MSYYYEDIKIITKDHSDDILQQAEHLETSIAK